MKSEAINWEQDLSLDTEEAYRSLVRSLRRTDGFSLLFARCSPVQGDRIISDIRSDLSIKTIEVLELKEPIDNLYDRIVELPNCDQINILFIKGLEYSIFAYEDREMNDINLRSQSSGYGGNWHGVPRVLGHLNLSRERFRDNFNFCFVFLLPEFALRYFIRRAPDFFDWRSNVFEFSTDKELLEQESYRLAHLHDSYEEYCKMTSAQRIAKLSQIRSCIDENSDPKQNAALWFAEGLIYASAEENEKAITSFKHTLDINSQSYESWINLGIAQDELGGFEEAIKSFDQAIKIDRNNHEAWNNRGYALGSLVRYEEAINSFDKALKINSFLYGALDCRGYALRNLGRYEEAIASFDKALKIKPDDYEALLNRGISLVDLGKYKEYRLNK